MLWLIALQNLHQEEEAVEVAAAVEVAEEALAVVDAVVPAVSWTQKHSDGAHYAHHLNR